MYIIDIIEGNELIAIFGGYVKSELPIFNHSTMSGFNGSTGFKGAYIEKVQYVELLGALREDNRLKIDEFYKKSELSDSYLFDGIHLFLSAYNNRSTPLNWKMASLDYHTSWIELMPIVEICYATDKGRFMQEVNTSMFASNNIEAVWSAVVRFIKWYNAKTK